MIHIIALAGVVGSPDLAPAPAPHSPAPALPSTSALQDEEAEPEGPVWAGSVNLGYTTTSGNTDVETLSANFDATRESDTDRITLKAFANRNSENGNTTQRQVGASAQYDYFISEEWYLLARTAMEKDRNAQLDLRFTAGAGAGYRIWIPDEESTKSLDVEVGLTYFSEEFDSGQDTDYIAAQLATSLHLDFNENVAFDSDVFLYPSLEDSDNFNAKWDSRLRSSLTENMFAQLQFVLDYDNTPATDVGTGLELEKTDTRLVATLGWSF